MKKNKRPLILKIVWIAILCFTFLLIQKTNMPSAEAAVPSVTVTTETLKTWNVTCNVPSWDDRVFNSTPKIDELIKKLDLTITRDGNVKFDKGDSINNTCWEGDYYYEYCLNWEVLDEKDDTSNWIDSQSNHNCTGYEKGWTYRVKANGTTVTGDKLDKEASGLSIKDGYNTIELTLALVYVDGYSYDIDQRSCYFYNYTLTGQILMFDEEPPQIAISNGAYFNRYLYNISVTDNVALSKVYYYYHESRWPSSITDTKTDIAASGSKVLPSFTKNGYFELHAIDTYNNSTTVKFCIDTGSPQISGVQQNGIYNTAQTIHVTDSLSGVNTVRVNGNLVQLDYSNNYRISVSTTTSQVISVECTDKAGNKTTTSFRYDVQAPSISGVEQNAVVKNATITYSDNSDNLLYTGYKGIAQAKYGYSQSNEPSVADTDFTSGKSFTEEGNYFIEIKDQAGNITQRRFTIDKTAPTITGVTNNGYYNSTQTLTFSDKNGLAKLKINNEEKSLASSYSFSNNGTYEVEVTDKAGNSSSIRFTIDKTDPTLSVTNHNNFSNNIYYSNGTLSITSNERVTFTFDGQKIAENTTSVSINARNYESGRKVLTATDIAGNSSTVNLFLDTSSPNMVFRNSILRDSYYYTRQSESIEFTSSYSPILEVSYTLNGGSVNKTNANPLNLSSEGTYRITVTTKAGNSTTKYLIIDKTAPTIGITSKGQALLNNAYTNQQINVTFSDNIAINEEECFYSFEGGEKQRFTTNTNFSNVGNYTFWIADKAGNTKSQQVTIETTAPTITGVTQNSYYRTSQTLTFFDEVSGIQEVKINGEVVTLTNSQYRVSATTDSHYEVECTDRAGNKANLTFHMDMTCPTTNIDKKYYNYDFRIQINDFMLDAASYIKKDADDPIYLRETASYSITTFGDGEYTLYLIDKAGNTVTHTFTIDTIPPEGILSGYTSVKDSIYLANASSVLKFTFQEDEATATFNNTSYTSGSSISTTTLEDGSYSFILTDKAGNFTTYTVDLKSSVPTASISGYYSYLDSVYYGNNSSVLTISWNDPTAHVLFQDNEYRNDFTILCSTLEDDTNYEIRIEDTYGNYTTYSFIVDKTPDSNNYNALIKNNYSWINHWYNTFDYTYTNSNFVKGQDFSFATQKEAIDFAWNRENSTVDSISYTGQTVFTSKYYGTVTEFYDYENLPNVAIGDTIYLYKSRTTNSKIVVYFDYQNLYDSIQFYIQKSIEEKYRFFDSEENIQKAYNQDLYYSCFYINQTSYTLNRAESTTSISVSKDHTTYIPHTNKAILSEGYNYVRETDRAGNMLEYVVILNITPITYSVLTPGNVKDAVYTTTLQNEHILYSSMSLTLALNSNYPEHNILKIQYTSLNNEKTTSFITDDGAELSKEGTYIIDTYDIFGNKSSTNTIYILYSAPQTTSEITKIDGIIIDLHFEILYQKLVQNQITNILVQYTDIEGNSTYLTKDANDIPISTEATKLTFVESGTYTLMITDVFGNSSTTSEVLQKGKPFGQLYAGNPATSIPSGSITNQPIYFSFNTEYEYTCTLNGAKYSSGTPISIEGIYEFILSNADSTATYTIEIDKTAPTSVLYDRDTPIETGITTSSKTIRMDWEEEGITVLLNGIPYEKNSYLRKEGKNIFKLMDIAGNVVEKTVTIDWTPPKVRIMSGRYEVENGSIVNTRIKFEWDENNCTAYCNGVLYSSGKLLTTANTYNLTITDRYGNSALYTCTLDLSTPEFKLVDVNGNELSSGAKINTGFYITWDGDYSVYLNDAIYTKEAVISMARVHTIQVINIAGTIVTSTVSISYTPPTALIYDYNDTLLKNGSITNQRFYITWTDSKDNKLSCTLNDMAYSKGKVITTDGEYTITILDEFGNSSIYTLTRDTVAPTGILHGVIANSITNQNVTFEWQEEDCTVLLNDLIYLPQTIISEEGTHKIQITDLAGNTNSYSFTIDKTPPVFQLSQELNENQYCNKRLSISWSESQCVAMLNDKSYIRDTLISDGTYTFVLTDTAGNSSSIHFIIDRSVPHITISGIDSKGNTNQPVTLSWNEDYIVLLNGIAIESGTKVTEDGVYEVIVENLAGNTDTYSFEISTKAPQGILNGVENTQATNQIVSFYFEAPSTATLNNQAYISGTAITREGTYTIILTDKFSNTNVYTFTIDKTPPVATLNGVKPNGTTNTVVSITFDEEDATAALNGVYYTSGREIIEEGSYELILTDKVGNSTTYTFIIDKTAPSINLFGVENGKTTNQSVYITWLESGCSAYLNEKEYTSGTYIREEGFYEFKIMDKLGNEAFYTFSIDKTAPDIIIYDESTNILSPNTIINHSFYILWQEENCIAEMNGVPYNQELIKETGEYIFKIWDALGNQKQIFMQIDYAAPLAKLFGVENGQSTKETVYLEFKSDCTATLNDQSYTSGKKITEEGFYTFIIQNKIGNSTTYTFTIDKTAPTIKEIQGLNENNYGNSSVVFLFDIEDATATLNDTTYASGDSITEDGEYELKLMDAVGNTSSFFFWIKTSKPEGILDGVENQGYTNKPVSLSWKDKQVSATLNALPYSSGTPIIEDGKYELILKDLAGNTNTYTFNISTQKPSATLEGINEYNLSNSMVKIYYSGCECLVNDKPYDRNGYQEEGFYTVLLKDRYGNNSTYTFTIDKTAPIAELSGVENQGYTNKPVYITWQEANCTTYLNNERYEKGSSIRKDGEYTFLIIDQAGNTSSYSFSISQAKPSGLLNGTFNGKGNFTNQDVTFTWEESSCTATLNGNIYTSGTIISEEGDYIVHLTNKYGNTSSYEFTIDKTNPICKLIGVENGGYTNKKVTIDLNYEANITTYVNDILFEKETITTNNMELYNGTYHVKFIDLAGNITEYYFEYYYENESSLKEKLTIEASQNNTTAIISFDGDYTLTINDQLSENGAILNQEGKYTINLSDKFGNIYSTQIKISAEEIPNYTLNNIATILSIVLGCCLIGFIIFKKVSGSKNPYKKNK